jgi:hypothetical protein
MTKVTLQNHGSPLQLQKLIEAMANEEVRLVNRRELASLVGLLSGAAGDPRPAAPVVCPASRGRTEVQIPMALREAEGRRTITTRPPGRWLGSVFGLDSQGFAGISWRLGWPRALALVGFRG